MRALCVYSNIDKMPPADRTIVSRFINIDGDIQELDEGKIYNLFAIESRSDGGSWLFVNSIRGNDFPSAYPSELFTIVDASIPAGWAANIAEINGFRGIQRLGFSEWALDDEFFAHLIDGSERHRQLYLAWRTTLDEPGPR